MYFETGDAKYLRRSYVYLIGPICGGILAGYFYRYWWLPRKLDVDIETAKKNAEP